MGDNSGKSRGSSPDSSIRYFPSNQNPRIRTRPSGLVPYRRWGSVRCTDGHFGERRGGAADADVASANSVPLTASVATQTASLTATAEAPLDLPPAAFGGGPTMLRWTPLTSTAVAPSGRTNGVPRRRSDTDRRCQLSTSADRADGVASVFSAASLMVLWAVFFNTAVVMRAVLPDGVPPRHRSTYRSGSVRRSADGRSDGRRRGGAVDAAAPSAIWAPLAPSISSPPVSPIIPPPPPLPLPPPPSPPTPLP